MIKVLAGPCPAETASRIAAIMLMFNAAIVAPFPCRRGPAAPAGHSVLACGAGSRTGRPLAMLS